MKVEILEETKDKIKFKMYNTRYSIPEMLKKQLLTHKEVVMASGMLKHPEDSDCEFILVVKSANPREILLKGIEELQQELMSFKEGALKEFSNDDRLKSSAFERKNSTINQDSKSKEDTKKRKSSK